MQPKLDKFSPTGKCFRHLFQLEFELRSQLVELTGFWLGSGAWAWGFGCSWFQAQGFSGFGEYFVVLLRARRRILAGL